jgi:hypothetical protein
MFPPCYIEIVGVTDIISVGPGLRIGLQLPSRPIVAPRGATQNELAVAWPDDLVEASQRKWEHFRRRYLQKPHNCFVNSINGVAF